MKKTQTEGTVVETLTLTELCRFCQTDSDWIMELVNHGVLDPLDGATGEWEFHAISIARARKARRLQKDFEVNTAALALILDLLEDRDTLRRIIARSDRP